MGKMSRVNYKCSNETDYKWVNYIETSDCEYVSDIFWDLIINFFKKVWGWIIFWD
jgi:hypothetical protein